MKLVSIIFYPEPPPIFYKDTQKNIVGSYSLLVAPFGKRKQWLMFGKIFPSNRSNCLQNDWN